MPPDIEDDFIDYITGCRGVTIYSIFLNSDGSMGLQESEYKNRWAESYKNRFLKKLYRLQDWYNDNPQPVTFITFTTKHRKTDFIPDQLTFLRENFLKLKNLLNKKFGTFDYIGNLDFHRSGHGHYHFVFFLTLTVEEVDDIKNIWSKKYGAGSFEKGIDVSTVPMDRMNYVASYIFRHSAKLFDFDFKRPGSLKFNAAVRHMHVSEKYNSIRGITCSRNISKIMKLPKMEDVEYLATSQEFLIDKNGTKMLKKLNLRSKDDIPSINEYLDSCV